MNRFSKKIVALVIFLNTAFTGAVLFLFLKTGSEPATLITAFFAFTTVELWSLSKITRDRLKQPGKENDNEDLQR